jgi:acyl carrier protein
MSRSSLSIEDLVRLVEQVTGGSTMLARPDPQTRLEDLGVTSLYLFTLIAHLEDELDIAFDDDDVELAKLVTFGDLQRLLASCDIDVIDDTASGPESTVAGEGG